MTLGWLTELLKVTLVRWGLVEGRIVAIAHASCIHRVLLSHAWLHRRHHPAGIGHLTHRVAWLLHS